MGYCSCMLIRQQTNVRFYDKKRDKTRRRFGNEMMSSLTAIDGNYTQWTEWSDCGVTCGSGVQNRSRSCTNPTPQYDGKSCEDVGPADETKECNKNPCRK